jgi:hypothetical protein
VLAWATTRKSATLEIRLAITLDVESGGWLVEMTTPSLLAGLVAGDERIYSRTVVTIDTPEQDTTTAEVDALLIMHLKFLGFA